MALKRAVEGRSMSYDDALAAFNRKKEAEGILPKKKNKDKNGGTSKPAGSSSGNIAVPPVGESALLSKQSSIASSAGMHFPGDGGGVQAYNGPNLPGAHAPPAPKPFSSSTKPPQTQLKAGVQSQLGPNGSLTIPASSKPAFTGKASSAAMTGGASKSKPSASGAAASNSQSATGPAGTSAAAGAVAAGNFAAAKKKSTGDKKRTTGKSTKAAKADLILGEVEDPPEPGPSASAAAAVMTDASGQLVLEEEAPDSDDELEQLLMAVGTFSRPRPLAMQSGLSLNNAGRTGGRYQQRYRESFMTAFTGRSMAAKSAG